MHLTLYFVEAPFTSRATRCEFLRVLHKDVLLISSQAPSKISAVLFFFPINSCNNIIWFFGFWKWAFKITGSCQSWTIISRDSELRVKLRQPVYNTVCFMWTTHFCFTVPYSVLTTKGCFCRRQTADPLLPISFSLPPTPTPAMAFFSKMISP